MPQPGLHEATWRTAAHTCQGPASWGPAAVGGLGARPLEESGACLNGLVRRWDRQPSGGRGFDIVRSQVMVRVHLGSCLQEPAQNPADTVMRGPGGC